MQLWDCKFIWNGSLKHFSSFVSVLLSVSVWICHGCMWGVTQSTISWMNEQGYKAHYHSITISIVSITQFDHLFLNAFQCCITGPTILQVILFSDRNKKYECFHLQKLKKTGKYHNGFGFSKTLITILWSTQTHFDSLSLWTCTSCSFTVVHFLNRWCSSSIT